MILLVVLDNVNPDLSDSEFLDPEEGGMDEGGQDEMDISTSAQVAEEEGDEEEDEEDEEEGDIDEELAAELAREMGEEGDEEEEEEGSESESEEEEDEDEDEEAVQARSLLMEEIRDLEAAISRKESEISASLNPIIKVILQYFVIIRSHHTDPFWIRNVSKTNYVKCAQIWNKSKLRENKWSLNSGRGRWPLVQLQ